MAHGENSVLCLKRVAGTAQPAAHIFKGKNTRFKGVFYLVVCLYQNKFKTAVLR